MFELPHIPYGRRYSIEFTTDSYITDVTPYSPYPIVSTFPLTHFGPVGHTVSLETGESDNPDLKDKGESNTHIVVHQDDHIFINEYDWWVMIRFRNKGGYLEARFMGLGKSSSTGELERFWEDTKTASVDIKLIMTDVQAGIDAQVAAEAAVVAAAEAEAAAAVAAAEARA